MSYEEAERKIEQARNSQQTGLSLIGLGLGSLPESLGQLTQLRTLEVYGNQLTALPESLGQLTKLQTLEAFNNQLTSLPEWLGQLTQLQTLDVAGNQLSSLPESLGQLTQLQTLEVSSNQLTVLPESLGQLTQLQTLEAFHNQLTALPEWLGQLAKLQTLSVAGNQLTVLPESLGQLTQLQTLAVSGNQLTSLPESLGQLTQLQTLEVYYNQLTALPESLGLLIELESLAIEGNQLVQLPNSFSKLRNLRSLWIGHDENSNPLREFPECLRYLKQLETLGLSTCGLTSLPDWVDELTCIEDFRLNHNQLRDLPSSIERLAHLESLELENNPLNPELAAAYEQGLDAVKTYLRAKAEKQLVLNEAKLILIGEGEVGKTSLLSALRGDKWLEKREQTRGIEVTIKTLTLTDADTGTEIAFNGWDFGGQNVYRHTHQLFFTAPAIYLAVWNPRRGAEGCKVDEWIKMVKQRAFDESRPEERPRILIVATHGGPKEPTAHIDEDLLRDEFGDLIVGFHHINSRPDPEANVCYGLEELKDAIAREAANIPSVGRSVPKSWKDVLDELRNRSENRAYTTYTEFNELCAEQGVADDLVELYAAILNELGHVVHYHNDDQLKDTVILKPEWLSKAISYVIDDELAKEQRGLVEHDHLSEMWNDDARPVSAQYPKELHPVFIRLMERFDLSYQVAMPKEDDPPTSLVAQLVPGGRPDGWQEDWPTQPAMGDAERKRICRMVDAETGRTTEVEGLIYRLIVRLHRYSLGRTNYYDSRHWKTGMILEDGVNGRAFLEEIAGDVHVTVRAAYPDGFLGNLCAEIEWLVNYFWKGLNCRRSVPCHRPCKGLHEVKALVETKQEGISKVRCSVCEKFLEIDSLLLAATAKPPMEVVLAELRKMRKDMADVKKGVADLDSGLRLMVGQANEQFDLLMNALTDPAKDGPRLFSFAPVKPSWREWFNPKTWTTLEFRLALWCEHSRLPLPVLHQDANKGVYKLKLTREWVKKAAPVLKFLSTTLSLALPVAASGAKLALDQTLYNNIEDQLEFGKSVTESLLDGGEQLGDWLSTDDETSRRQAETIRAEGSVLRELHEILKDVDKRSNFGGLVRVQNKRREFLWVDPQFAQEY